MTLHEEYEKYTQAGLNNTKTMLDLSKLGISGDQGREVFEQRYKPLERWVQIEV